LDRSVKTVIFWFVIVLAAVLLWQTVRSGGSSRRVPEISYSEFLSQVEAGRVSKVTISGTEIYGSYRDNREFRVIGPSSQADMLYTLHQNNVEIWFRQSSQGGWGSWLLNLAPLVLLAVLWFFMIRQMRLKRSAAPPTGTATADSSTWRR
jgi:cell division protease FtsH